ncbi:MAG: hypothetical protein AAB692_05170 [Patescibacteria group bacterium]
MNLNNRFAFAAFLAAVFACPPASLDPAYPSDCPTYANWDYGFHYQVHPGFKTPDGIQVDPTGQQISPRLVDRLTRETERCLEETFGNPPRIPDELLGPSDCIKGDSFPLPFRRDCFAVKVPDNWSWADANPRQQVLADKAPAGGCIDKGQCKTTEGCDCHWRAGVQGRVVVTTPSFYIYKDALIRLMTGCGNPWAVPEFARCAAPTTAPDSMGDQD